VELEFEPLEPMLQQEQVVQLELALLAMELVVVEWKLKIVE